MLAAHSVGIVVFSVYGPFADLLSFPTRRSSDLQRSSGQVGHRAEDGAASTTRYTQQVTPTDPHGHLQRGRHEERRSEEHTSELLSQSNLVCRLMLEKKNTP